MKSEFMVIGNPRKYSELKGSRARAPRIGDSLKRRVKQTKSVRVIINQNLSWKFRIKYILKDPKKY